MIKDINLSGALQKLIFDEMINSGYQSPQSIFRLRRDQFNKLGKTFDEKTQRSTISNMFRELLEKDKIALIDDTKKKVGGYEKFYGLTDTGLSWYQEKYGSEILDVIYEKIWQVSMVLDERTNEMKHPDKKATVLVWNTNKLFDYYKKNYNIPKYFINSFGSAIMLDLLKYLKIREQYIWIINGKDCKEKAISILKNYAIKRKDKLKVDRFHYFVDKLEQKLFDERLIHYHTIKGKTNVTISIFGILFLIVNLTDNDEIENIIKHNPDKLPLVFDNKIWFDIKQLINNKAGLSLSTFVKEIFTQGFTRTFDNSFRYTQLNHLNKLYQVEYNGYSKLVKLWKNGLDIFNSLAEKNQCKTDFQDYLWNIGDRPDSFKKFENSCLQFKILNNIISEREQFSFPPDLLPKINDDEQNIVMMPILESISFHFYTYLQTLKLTKKEWEYFLNNNPKIKEFLHRWNQEIEESSIKLVS